MLAYHVDRHGCLYEGQGIILFTKITNLHPECNYQNRLYGSGASNHGALHMVDIVNKLPPFPGGADIVSGVHQLAPAFVEYNSELVRRAFFPKRISRFESFFALEQLSDLSLWPELKPTAQTKIWEIEFDKCQSFKADSSFLKGGVCAQEEAGQIKLGFSPMLNFQMAYSYWNGDVSEFPKYELLLKPPIIVRKRVE